MLVASELKGELARIHPARACCRRAELAGLLYANRAATGAVRTLDPSTARIAVHLAGALGHPTLAPSRDTASQTGGRHHLAVALDAALTTDWSWPDARACDHRAFLRGVILTASVSAGRGGLHVEVVLPDAARARRLKAWLREVDVKAALIERRGRHVVYIKGQEEIGALLRLTGANRTLLDFETARVSRDVRNRLNRALNAEEANLARTVRAADRQLRAIAELEASGTLRQLAPTLREAARERRRQPDADLDTLAAAMGVGRSTANYRLRRLVSLADSARDEPEATG
jgi:DNA-binding transcriptional regulator WhiA